MKKWIAALSASVLAVSFALLAGCSAVKSDGTISGNYHEAEDADMQQLLTALTTDSEKLFGDMSAEDWRFGLHGVADFSYTMAQGTTRSSLGAEADLAILLSEGGSGLSLGGSLDLNTESTADGETQSAQIGIDPYIDAEYVYFNVTSSSSSASGDSSTEERGKIALGDLGLTVPDLGGLTDQAGSVVGADVEAFRNNLNDYGVELAVDTSSGIKARFSFSTEGIREMIKEMLGSMGYVDTSGYTVNISSDTLEMYLMIEADGTLSACTMRADFSVTVPDPGFDYFTYMIDEDAADLTIAMSGMFSITSDDADIVYPSDLAEYPEFDLSGLLPGILG